MYFTGFGNGPGEKKENMRMFETERGSQFTFICCLQSSLMPLPPVHLLAPTPRTLL